MKKSISLVLLVLIVLLMPTPYSSAAATKDPIKIGFVHCLSGTYSVYGHPSLAAVKIAVAEINAAGGVLGRPLELISRDDKTDPNVGLREASDLVLREKVDFLIGTIASNIALAISDFAREKKKIFFTYAQASEITADKGHRYVFRISTNTSAYARSDALAVAKLPYKKYFSIHPNYAYGKSVHNTFWESIRKLRPDIQMVGEAWPKFGTTDYTPYISQILNSGAEAMFTCFAGQDGINFFKGAMGFKLFEKVFVIDPDMGYIESLAPLGKDFPEGFLGSQHYPFYILDNPASNAFVKKYREATGTLPNLAVQSYVTVYALANAIKKAGVVDVEKVVDALSGMKLKDTPVGDMIIQDFDHQATWPYWLGKVKYSEKHGLAILTNPESFPAEKIYQSRDEVKALRAKGGR